MCGKYGACEGCEVEFRQAELRLYGQLRCDRSVAGVKKGYCIGRKMVRGGSLSKLLLEVLMLQWQRLCNDTALPR